SSTCRRSTKPFPAISANAYGATTAISRRSRRRQNVRPRPLAVRSKALPTDCPWRFPAKGSPPGPIFPTLSKKLPPPPPPPTSPTSFTRGRRSLVPHGQPILRPKASETHDYEAELILIIGKRAKHLTPANAYACIAGYSCGNEGSVREFQRKTTQWDMGKNFDRTGAFGPWMITADEVPAGGKGLKSGSRVNGEGRQADNTNNMMLPVAETIAYITQGMTLEPGDIVFTGTPSGVGHARKPNPVWMKAGDVCEIDIEGVGLLVNPIEDEK